MSLNVKDLSGSNKTPEEHGGALVWENEGYAGSALDLEAWWLRGMRRGRSLDGGRRVNPLSAIIKSMFPSSTPIYNLCLSGDHGGPG